MPSSLFNFTILCAMTGLAMAGCANTPMSSSSNQHRVIVHAVSAQGVGQAIGNIHFKDSPAGLVINTHLSDLPPGPHGFHIHEKGSCDPAEKDGKMGAAIAAGGHFNPDQVSHGFLPKDGHSHAHAGDMGNITVSFFIFKGLFFKNIKTNLHIHIYFYLFFYIYFLYLFFFNFF